jgi:hypothetical protein
VNVGQLFPVEHILRDCALQPTERSFLRKFSRELDCKLDIKKDLGAVVRFLNFLPHLFTDGLLD